MQHLYKIYGSQTHNIPETEDRWKAKAETETNVKSKKTLHYWLLIIWFNVH